MANDQVCEKCKAEVPSNANFCPNCGNRQEQSSNEDQEQEQKKNPQKSKSDPKEKEYPNKIEIDFVGKEGEYSFDIQVLSQNEKGIPATVNINEGGNVSRQIETNSMGLIEGYKAEKFNDIKRTFYFRVIGTPVKYKKVLSGPSLRTKIKKRKVSVVDGGFWANVKNVLEAKKGEK